MAVEELKIESVCNSSSSLEFRGLQNIIQISIQLWNDMGSQSELAVFLAPVHISRASRRPHKGLVFAFGRLFLCVFMMSIMRRFLSHTSRDNTDVLGQNPYCFSTPLCHPLSSFVILCHPLSSFVMSKSVSRLDSWSPPWCRYYIEYVRTVAPRAWQRTLTARLRSLDPFGGRASCEEWCFWLPSATHI